MPRAHLVGVLTLPHADVDLRPRDAVRLELGVGRLEGEIDHATVVSPGPRHDGMTPLGLLPVVGHEGESDAVSYGRHG